MVFEKGGIKNKIKIEKFEVFDKEFQGYMHTFLKKVEQYYANCTKAPDDQGTKNDQKGLIHFTSL